MFLSNMDYKQSKEFMVFNYSIFTEDTFLEGLMDTQEFLPKLDQYRLKKQQDAIDEYIQIWSVLVNSFKKYTDFSLEPDTRSRLKLIGFWFLKALKNTLLYFLGVHIDTTRDVIIGKFIENILSLMFSPAAAGVFSYLNTFVATIITPMFEWFINKFKAKFKDLGKILFKKMKSFLKRKNVHRLIDFDYMKELNSTEEKDSEPEITIKPKKVDEAYKAAIEYKTNPMGVSDRVYLYNDNDRMLPVESIGDSQIFIDMEQLKKTKMIPSKQLQKYEQFLAKNEELMQLRDAALGKGGQVERLKRRLVVV
jgi:hypothetical protein